MSPDFSKYSISELQDVISHIDNAAYPERKRKAEEILRCKLNTSEVNDIPIKDEIDKRRLSIFLGTIFTVLSLALLYKPVFESSVLTRSSGVISYSQSPFVFWFHTLLYLFSFLGFIFWVVKLISSKPSST